MNPIKKIANHINKIIKKAIINQEAITKAKKRLAGYDEDVKSEKKQNEMYHRELGKSGRIRNLQERLDHRYNKAFTAFIKIYTELGYDPSKTFTIEDLTDDEMAEISGKPSNSKLKALAKKKEVAYEKSFTVKKDELFETNDEWKIIEKMYNNFIKMVPSDFTLVNLDATPISTDLFTE